MMTEGQQQKCRENTEAALVSICLPYCQFKDIFREGKLFGFLCFLSCLSLFLLARVGGVKY